MRAGRTPKAVIVGAAGIALALTAAGCGSGSKPGAPATSGSGTSAASSSSPAPATSSSASPSGSSSSSAAAGVDSTAAALLPDSIKSKGTLTFATDPSYPPNESKDANGQIVGWDVDLGTAIAAKLGLKASFTEVTFDDIVTGISTGKYDAGMSSITDNKKREGVDDFVTYFNAGTKLMVAKGNPKKLTGSGATDLSLCGMTVGVEKGTVQETDDIPNRNKACEAAGKKDIKTLSQDTQDQINQSLGTGRCDAVLADSPVVDYYAKSGNFEAVGDIYAGAPYGIAIAKSNSGLSQAVQAALKDLVQDGTYHQLTTKYGIQAGDYTTPGLNQATS
ncbi:ABC transporter substrate-binding protein [Catenulispora yoronensis]|uniref:ABC transporter substrate-binding protein n=1 Tax=Catenulispora yoronensis TaxID=450799 RepID=A0ABP5GTZ8_9ACTN